MTSFKVWLSEDLHMEIQKLAKTYHCSMQKILQQIISIGILQIEKENTYEKICETKKFLEINLEENKK